MNMMKLMIERATLAITELQISVAWRLLLRDYTPIVMAVRSPHNNRRPRIILGITGSIAAVKGPRLALRLANELKADVKVVLTRTVEQYFWKEGRAVATYDRESWMDFERAVASSSSFTIASRIQDDENENEHSDWRSTAGSISVHCKFIDCIML